MTDTALQALPDDYRAWVWRSGTDPRNLALERIPRAQLLPGQLLVRNAMIGLNPVDWKVLGDDGMKWAPGKIPGVDGAGTVVAVGPDVPAAWLSRRVAYHQDLQRPGSFAEYTPLMAKVVIGIPDALDFSTAASVPCPALTAFLALDKLPHRPGAKMLVSGAGGAVGGYLVQLAVSRGFDVDVLCHARHWTRLRAMGARQCFDNATSATANGACFAVIDSVSSAHAASLAPALAANGHLVCIQGRCEHWPSEPFGPAFSLHEVALGALHRYGDDAAWTNLTREGERMLGAIVRGELQPEQQVIGGFSELGARLDALKNRQFSGKSLVAVEPAALR